MTAKSTAGSAASSTARTTARFIARLTASRTLMIVLQTAVTATIIAALVATFGARPFVMALSSVTILSALAALGIGTVATIVQAQRWRLVSSGVNVSVPFAQAVARCWQSGFLNAVLPGGLLGDVQRVAEQRALSARERTEHDNTSRWGQWRASIGPVWAERVAGTAIVVFAASVALIRRHPELAIPIGVLAVLIGALAVWALRRLRARVQLAVWALACASWCLFITLFGVAAASAGAAAARWEGAAGVAPLSVRDVLVLAAVSLAAMSLPISIGGWGLREAAAALAVGTMGFSGDIGVTVAASYGVLATISVLPGAVVLVWRSVRSARRRASAQVKLDAHVVPEDEASSGGPSNF